MHRSSWSSYWNAVRVAAGMPGQDFYELKHREIQWMVDPVDDGGLGLDPATAAAMVGHDDGDYRIAAVYTKLAERRAIARAQRAMDAYQQRRDAANAEPPRLKVVREAGQPPRWASFQTESCWRSARRFGKRERQRR
jgi:hypothetical protein